MLELQQLLESILPLDAAAMDAAQKRQAELAKPPGSLGRLEELSVQVAGITGRVYNPIWHTHLLVFAADNGVVEEGVSSAPKSVTWQQTVNLTRAKTGASVLCRHFGCGITVCDVGVDTDCTDPAVLDRKIARGTQNIARGPAMERAQAIKALEIGAEVARRPRRSFWVWAKWASAIQRPPLRSWLCCWAQIRRPLPDGAAASQRQLFKRKKR